MASLKDAKVWRGGISTDRRALETNDVDVEGSYRSLAAFRPILKVRHRLASKGGGTTAVTLEIGTGSFSQIIAAMLEADREATIAAFARAVLSTKKK